MALTEIPIELSSTPSIVDGGNATAITIDSSENVGIGMTPSAWHANWTALQLGATGFVGQYQAGATDITALGSNVFSDGAYKYIETDEAVIYKQQNGEHIFDVAASGSANAAISWTTALTINNSGNVGIGQASPDHALEITAAVGSQFKISRDSAQDTQFMTIAAGGNAVTFDSYETSTHSTYSWKSSISGSSLERMRIASSGQLFLFGQTSGAGNADLRYTTGTGAVTYDTSSRLVKAEIEDIPYGLSTVMALSPKRYERTDSDNKLEVGFIADEVVEVVPELVGMMEKRFLTMNQEDTEVIAGSVEYNKMTAVLVKAVQELKEELNTATARITELENN